MIRPHRGMTLIELLVSLALLGMIAVLVSTMWSQLRRWGQESNAAEAALRPQRVYMLLEKQWAARAQAGDDQALGRVQGDATAFSFVTHEAVLHRGWPTVEATYRVELHDPSQPEGRVRVVYEEKRLGPLLDVVPSEASEPLVLLENCAAASVRYRVSVLDDSTSENVFEEQWAGTMVPGEDELIVPLYVEFRAEQRREVIGWVGNIEPLH